MRAAPARTAAAFAMLWLAGCAAEPAAGVGRTVVGPADSKLIFYGAGPDAATAVHFRLDSATRGATGYLGVWSGAEGAFPQARISYYELAPGYHFSTPHDVGDYVGKLGFGDAGRVDLRAGGRLRNGLGPLDYRRFGVGPAACFAFAQSWGTTSSDVAGTSSTNRIVGYYCGGAGEELTDASLQDIVSAIGVRGQYEPEPPAGAGAPRGNPARLLVTARWEGYHPALSGTLLVTGAQGRGRMHLPLPAGGGDCVGEWRRRSGKVGTEAPPRGTWRLLCTNGRSAQGTFVGPAPLAGAGEGVDADGNRVTFTYGHRPGGAP